MTTPPGRRSLEARLAALEAHGRQRAEPGDLDLDVLTDEQLEAIVRARDAGGGEAIIALLEAEPELLVLLRSAIEQAGLT